MKKYLLMLFAAVISTAWTAEEERAGLFRIASWNIGHFALGKSHASKLTPQEGEKKAPEYRALLKSVNADLIGIAEYSENYTADGSMKAAETVFPDYPVFRVGPANFYQWNAQFMKQGKILDSRAVDYGKRAQKTYYLRTELEFGGRKIVWAATHLDWNKKNQSQICRTSQIMQLIRELENCPCVIITGDFNTKSADEFKVFEKHGFTLGNDGKYPTYPAGRLTTGKNAIDNIIVKGLRIRRFDVRDCPKLSDHTLIYADLEFLP